jgi:hypothetical protein
MGTEKFDVFRVNNKYLPCNTWENIETCSVVFKQNDYIFNDGNLNIVI